MKVSPLAGKPAPPSMLVNVPRLVTAYYAERPDPSIAAQPVAFGTSGHRGSAFELSFNEAHILAITQAICLYRKKHQIEGPLFLGMDTHALSEPAFIDKIYTESFQGADHLKPIPGRTPGPYRRRVLGITLDREQNDASADVISRRDSRAFG